MSCPKPQSSLAIFVVYGAYKTNGGIEVSSIVSSVIRKWKYFMLTLETWG